MPNNIKLVSHLFDLSPYDPSLNILVHPILLMNPLHQTLATDRLLCPMLHLVVVAPPVDDHSTIVLSNICTHALAIQPKAYCCCCCYWLKQHGNRLLYHQQQCIVHPWTTTRCTTAVFYLIRLVHLVHTRQ